MALIATQVSADWEFYGISLRMLRYAIFINFILAFFNLLPIPPLDGSKMLSSFLYGNTLRKYEDLARFTPMLFIGAMLLSFMGLHTIGYLLRPAQILSNYIMFGFLSLFGAVG
jgi:Zn-dependent protease